MSIHEASHIDFPNTVVIARGDTHRIECYPDRSPLTPRGQVYRVRGPGLRRASRLFRDAWVRALEVDPTIDAIALTDAEMAIAEPEGE